MPRLSQKRQVTLPKDLCDRLDVKPGDDLDMLEHGGRITIIKKACGRTAGMLKHRSTNPAVSEAESRDSAIGARRPIRA